MAQSFLDQGAALKALAHFQLACELTPTHADALIGKTRTLLQLGDLEQAARTCDQLCQNHETALVQALHEVITTQFNAQTPPRHINIGGGPSFNFTSWLNLETVPSPSNPIPTAFSAETTFPVDDGSIATVFSSHYLDRLDDQTLERCLREAHRVLDKEGVLVVKLPNSNDTANQRNASSQDQLNALLEKTGFRVLSTDAKRICIHQSHIPGIETMFDISSYTLAVVDGERS